MSKETRLRGRTPPPTDPSRPPRLKPEATSNGAACIVASSKPPPMPSTNALPSSSAQPAVSPTSTSPPRPPNASRPPVPVPLPPLELGSPLLYGSFLAEISTDPFARFAKPIITTTLLATLTRGGPWPLTAAFFEVLTARSFMLFGVMQPPPVLLTVVNALVSAVMFSIGTRASTVKPTARIDPLAAEDLGSPNARNCAIESLEPVDRSDQVPPATDHHGLPLPMSDLAEGRRVFFGFMERLPGAVWLAFWDATKLSMTASGLSIVLFVLSFSPIPVPSSVLPLPPPSDDAACPSAIDEGQGDAGDAVDCRPAVGLPFNLAWLDAYLVLSLVRVVLIRCAFFMP